MANTPLIGCLWTGGPLTYVELLSLASLRAAGHRVALFVYEPLETPPAGVQIRDASKIAARGAAPAPLFKDYFRYRLLAAAPGILWVDLDVVALGPLSPQDGRLFGWEAGGSLVSPDVLALPHDSAALAALIALTDQPAPIPPWAPEALRDALAAAAAAGEPVAAEDQPWGVWGAAALTWALSESGDIDDAAPPAAFFPVAFAERRLLTKRRADLSRHIRVETQAVHLYGGDLKRRLLAEEDGLPRYWSFLGGKLRDHEISPRAAPLPGAPVPPDHLWAERAPAAAEDSVPKPAVVPKPAARKADPAGRVLIVTTMKNEGPFLLEWIAYHRSIGITDFLVYTNDCDDGTDEYHDLLVKKGIVAEHLDNPFRSMKGVKPQHAAYWNAQTRPITEQANWVIPMDVDEFINIHAGQGQFQDMLDAAPEANMISMTWRLFGNGFVRDFEDGFVTERLTWCAHERARKPHQAWGFKTAFRNTGIYRKFGVHRPKGLKPGRIKDIKWIGSTGRPMPEAYHEAGWRASKLTWGYNLVTLNHYSLRSSESYLVKRDRGRVNHVDRDQGLAYWFRMNHNAVEDRSIVTKLPGAKAEYARLMADPDIAAMQARCVAAHRAKIKELMRRPDYRALFETIESKRMKNLSRMLMNFGNAIFDKGPDAVPKEFIAKADAAEHAGG
ncbi:MAG: glycosyltransferase family 2 protein [Pseudomonadota bacterium]